MKRDRTVASGSTIEGGGAILISPSRVQETGSGTQVTNSRQVPMRRLLCLANERRGEETEREHDRKLDQPHRHLGGDDWRESSRRGLVCIVYWTERSYDSRTTRRINGGSGNLH